MAERGSTRSPLSTLSPSRWEVVRSTVRKPRCWAGAGLLHLTQHVSGCLLAERGSSRSPLSPLSPSRWEVVRSTVRKPRCWSGAELLHLTQHVSGYLMIERGSSGLLLSSLSPSRWGGRLVWRPDSHSTSQVQGVSHLSCQWLLAGREGVCSPPLDSLAFLVWETTKSGSRKTTGLSRYGVSHTFLILSVVFCCLKGGPQASTSRHLHGVGGSMTGGLYTAVLGRCRVAHSCHTISGFTCCMKEGGGKHRSPPLDSLTN